ncbi:alpha/beta fold hydrolase [Cloacibacterium sp.]|uniref:alpha/beta fold hydrolase n=1 Tax=Cloacibacterium sp. TaxID=1913682 RepID=UPI0035B4CF46
MKKILVLFFNLLIFMVFSQEKLKNLDATLSNYEYPFEVKYLNFKSQNQDLKMAYMDVLPKKSNGKSVLLLHGKNFNGAYWKQTATELSKLGYRVIIPDQIGFGKSSKPSQYQYSFHQLAQNTKQILDELKIDKINVLGHSMGGMLATRFALMYPETTEKLILENPIGLEDYKTLTPYVSVDKMYQNELKQTAEDIKNYQLKFYYDNKWKPEYDEWMYLLAGWTVNKDYPLIAWNAALTYDMIFTQPVVYEFPKLKVPTLLIIGTRDRTALGKANASADVQSKMGLYQNLGKETQKKIPNSRLVEIENIGHLPHIEAFDKFIKPLVEFLK